MSITPDIDDLLQGGAAAFSFENFGDTCKGRVVRAETRRQTDRGTGQPKFFSSGEPMKQIVITVEQDDGEEVALYFKGGKWEAQSGSGQGSLEALRAALGTNKLEVGGVLAMQFTGLGKPTKGNPPKLYVCEYKPPALGIDPTVGLI